MTPSRQFFALFVAAVTCLAPAAGQARSDTGQARADAGPVPIDFSYAGYGAGAAIPLVHGPALLVRPGGADDTRLLQAALAQVAQWPRQANGIRGVVQLAPGRFRIAGQLRLDADGVVLRGSGIDKTVLVATGRGRRALIHAGKERAAAVAAPVRVTDRLVPVGARTLALADIHGLQVGARVVLTRPSTREWIRDLGMDALPGTFAAMRYHWPAGSRDLVWDRRIVAIDANDAIDGGGGRVTLDAPITTALEARYGGATLAKVTGDAPLAQVGIEHLAIDSAFDPANPHDEEHAWDGIVLDNVEDGWVRAVSGRHLVSSLVRVGPRARRITVEHVRVSEPVGEAGGYRRMSYLVEGQQVLVQHCRADAGMNDFAIGFLAAGPNVFRACRATRALGASGAYESWASGVLYEDVRVEGAALRLAYDTQRAQAGGWTAANSLIWNARAPELVAAQPAGAPNRIVHGAPPLYATQLARRVGARVADSVLQGRMPSAPTPQDARPFAGAVAQEAPQAAPPAPGAALAIRNGRFVVGTRTLWGGAVNDAWWLGQTSPGNALDAGMSITRFVPGRSGPGLTEDLPGLAARVASQGTPFYQSGPAIWYDRRRDDHTIQTRADANVWAAFYELPWARSGKGRAQDGLSRYDLTRYNPWYFARTREFARLADRHGIVLYHHLYNTHNLLETASHWADFPWRPANNINDTGLPEPMPLEPGERIHVANQFYDAGNPRLRALHRAYIFHALDQLAGHDNIVFGLAFQYSGPLAFQQFFQRTVAEWEQRHGRQVKLVLATSKDVTDAILADPELARQVAVIDMRYWHYLADGSLWAPKGGQNRAFRELHPREFGDPGTPDGVYRQVREVRARHPDKAIVSWHAGTGQIPSLMAGAAQVITRNPTAGHGQGRSVDRTPLDGFVQRHLSNVLADMVPQDGWTLDAGRDWVLADAEKKNVLVYSRAGQAVALSPVPGGTRYDGLWFDPRTGQTHPAHLAAQPRRGLHIVKPDGQEWLLLLRAQVTEHATRE